MDFNIANCRGCGKLFKRTGPNRLCPECVKALEEKYTEVRRYIADHKGVSIMEVSKELDVSVEQIKAWIREDRLQLDQAGDPDFCCLSCGVPIKSGKYCDRCKNKMINNLNGVYTQEKPVSAEPKQGTGKERDRMRFL